MKSIDVQDLGGDDDYWDDEKAEGGVGDYYGYSAEALQASSSEDEDSDYDPAPLGVREMKGRVNDREWITWLNESKHMELSHVYMVVSFRLNIHVLNAVR